MLEVVSEVAQDPRSGTEGQHPEAVPRVLDSCEAYSMLALVEHSCSHRCCDLDVCTLRKKLKEFMSISKFWAAMASDWG